VFHSLYKIGNVALVYIITITGRIAIMLKEATCLITDQPALVIDEIADPDSRGCKNDSLNVLSNLCAFSRIPTAPRTAGNRTSLIAMPENSINKRADSFADKVKDLLPWGSTSRHS
jgi:hypothetical protein